MVTNSLAPQQQGQPPMSRHFQLKNISTEQLYDLAGPNLVIGRGDTCEICIEAGLLSRQHARVEVRDGRCLIEDLGSTNGTFVNGTRIVRTTDLHHGDLLILGQERFYVIAPAQPGQRTGHESVVETNPDFHLEDLTSSKTMIRSAFPRIAGWETMHTGKGSDTEFSDDRNLVQSALSGKRFDARRVPAVLVVRSGRARGILIELKLPAGAASEWVIGRSQLSDVVLDDPTVSNSHAIIAREDGQWTLRDQRSTNGVKLNGEKISEAQCKSGDKLAIGNVEFILLTLV